MAAPARNANSLQCSSLMTPIAWLLSMSRMLSF